MAENRNNLFIGLAIILIGVLALLNNFVFDGIENIIGSLFFFIVAYLFFQPYHRNNQKIWALFPATFCAALGLILLLQQFTVFPDALAGVIVLWTGAAVFTFFYGRNNKMWWAVILSGILFTLGAIVLIDAYSLLNNGMEGSVLFLGFGLTFIYLYLQRDAENKLDWAIWPGGFLLLFALFVYFQNVNWMDSDFILPLLLILIGGYLIFRTSKKSKSQSE